MKKSIIMLAAALTLTALCSAQGKGTIDFKSLPSKAQTFLNTYMDKSEIALIKMDTDKKENDYKVYFDDGSKVKFDNQGDWEKIKLRNKGVPEELVDPMVLIYIHTEYPDLPILALERDSKGYEVELSNGMELKFNKTGQLVKID